jgi:hypothetical protein
MSASASKRVKGGAGKRRVVHLTKWQGDGVDHGAYVLRDKFVLDPQLLAVLQTWTTRTLLPGDSDDDEGTVDSEDEDGDGEQSGREYDMYVPVEEEPLVKAGTHVALARGYRLYTFAKAEFNMYPEAERITCDDLFWGAVTRATEVRRYRGGCDYYGYYLDMEVPKPYETNPETKLPNGLKNVGDAPMWSTSTGVVLVFENPKKGYTEMVTSDFERGARSVPKDAIDGDEDVVFLSSSSLLLPPGPLDAKGQTRVLLDNPKLGVPSDDTNAFY